MLQRCWTKKRYIQIIQEKIESLKEMLEELLTHTKLQNGTYELKLERENVGQVLKETVFSYYDNWMKQGIVTVVRFAVFVLTCPFCQI